MKANPGNGVAQLVDHAHGIVELGAGQDHDELFAAVTCNEVRAADATRETFSNGAQYSIARAVSVRVVDALETIDVPHGHADRLLETPARRLRVVSMARN